MRNIFGIIVFVSVVFGARVFAQQEKEYTLDGVLVTGSRLPIDSTGVRHTVVTIPCRDIEQSPARSVEELLQTVAGVDVRQRGAFGVQTDVGIWGGSFEQTLVMIDGIKMTDAQTGHHNFNIPLTEADIERIEVLKGSGSRQYGPNAFNGAINIITKKHATPFVRADVMGGEHGLWEGLVSTGLPQGLFTNTISYSKKRSNGYCANTDFDITTVAVAAGFAGTHADALNASLNFVEKKFGANGFYSAKFPNQWEHTKTLTASFGGTIASASPLTFTTFYRRNNDYFILNREDPKFYANTHTTNSYGGEVRLSFQSVVGITALGAEVGKVDIESSRLGVHARERASVAAEHQIDLCSGLTLEFGASGQWYSDWRWNLSPGVDIGWQAGDRFRIYASVGKSFRVPTYTELFYSDPATLGNAHLRPEESWTYELGSVYTYDDISITAAVFNRRAYRLIDFMRTSVTAPWAANNISDANTSGTDISVTLPLAPVVRALETLRLSYAYAQIAFSGGGGTSRYELDNLKHHFVGALSLAWIGAVYQSINVRYEDRLGSTANTLVDSRLGYLFSSVDLYGEVSNLFNTRVEDIAGILLAGRWVRAGISLRFGAQQ